MHHTWISALIVRFPTRVLERLGPHTAEARARNGLKHRLCCRILTDCALFKFGAINALSHPNPNPNPNSNLNPNPNKIRHVFTE